MAQKKITDLQLIAAIVDGLNIPSDDGIQSYRATALQLKNYILANGNVQLAMLADTIFNGLTGVAPADDDYLVINDTSDGNKTKKALAGNFVRNAVRAVSTFPATVTSADTSLKLSGSSGTITLPTAVGIDGKRFKFIHGGTNFSQVYTIGTTSGQTIGTIAGGSYALYTNGEVLEVESDGANWMIVGRVTETDWIDMGAMTIDVISGSNPTKPTTVVYDKIWALRRGKTVNLRYRYKHTNNSGSNAGSGKYRWLIPFTVDTTAYPASTATDFGTAADVVNAYMANIGYGSVASQTGNHGMTGHIALFDSTHFTVKTFQPTPQLDQIDNDYFDLNKSTLSYAFDIFNLPVSGWQP